MTFTMLFSFQIQQRSAADYYDFLEIGCEYNEKYVVLYYNFSFNDLRNVRNICRACPC